VAYEATAVDPVPPGERGAMRIADRVVAKIASQAAREALAGAPEARRVPVGARPHATVSVRSVSAPGRTDSPHDEARVRVAVELGYPSDIGAQCGAVRREVAQRVRALAGMDVLTVFVTVERLHLVHSASEQRRVR
jgi:uncharacterized alkaline shock family protein YloU